MDLTLVVHVMVMQNGEVYYVNKVDGTKTARDPRHRFAAFSDSDSEPQSGVEDGDEDEDEDEDDEEGDLTSSDECTDWSDKKKDTTPSTSSSSSSISTASSCSTACSRANEKEEASDGDGVDEKEEIRNGGVLVLVGCQVCFTLSMVAQPAMECGKCGSAALRHF